MYKNKKSLQETHPHLAAEWHPIKNGCLTPNDVTIGSSKKKVWWLLPYDDPKTGKHFNFEWTAAVLDRAKGCGCPYLSGNAVQKGFNDLATTHPELAAEWHLTKNNNLTPNDISAGSNKRVWWYLPYDDPVTSKHFDFEWQASVSSRVKGRGCPYLSNRAVWKGFNDLATTHPELAAQWHPTKNGSLTPADVTSGSDKNVWWLLPYDDSVTGKHFDFEWEAAVRYRTGGSGCPYLSGQAAWKGFNDLATTHPELAIQWHPTKNGKLTPDNITASVRKRVWWLLPYDEPKTGKHFNFEWQATIASRANGVECPYLSGHAVWKDFNDLATTHPDIAAQWHPTKNGSLTPADVTAGSEKKVWWKNSDCGHEWLKQVYNQKRNAGCSICSSSQGEKTIYNLLKSYSINFIKEYSFPDCKYKIKLRFDFAIFDKNNNLVFLIEYDGKQHADNIHFFNNYSSYENRQERDEVKTQYCKNNNIPLLRISYEDAKKIEDIVVSKLKKYNLI